MRHWLWMAPLLWACEPRPVALFTVECATDACDTVRFVADPNQGGRVFSWTVDGGVPVATGAEYEHPGNLAAAEYVALRSTNSGGSDERGLWVVANQVLELDGKGAWEATAAGFELVEEKDRTIDTECGPLAVVTSIGGCFTGTQPATVHLSLAGTGTAGPPTPLDSSNYQTPATFLPGLTPDVTRGSWDGARAFAGGPPLSVGWDPATTSSVTAEPRFETAYTLASLTDIHWAIVETSSPAGPGFHQNAVRFQCDVDQWRIGSVVIPESALDDWASGRQ